mmetsp:Transcript_45132/g.139230  ORF Transcript_45132/g.139230 Transcript_45132/m.139230 type:complete len:226 (-) Transcript_45132:1137-1814(-)
MSRAFDVTVRVPSASSASAARRRSSSPTAFAASSAAPALRSAASHRRATSAGRLDFHGIPTMCAICCTARPDSGGKTLMTSPGRPFLPVRPAPWTKSLTLGGSPSSTTCVTPAMLSPRAVSNRAMPTLRIPRDSREMTLSSTAKICWFPRRSDRPTSRAVASPRLAPPSSSSSPTRNSAAPLPSLWRSSTKPFTSVSGRLVSTKMRNPSAPSCARMSRIARWKHV